MSCHNCVRHVTDAIQRVPGVAGAVVSLETRRAVVRWAAGANADAAAVVRAVKAAGYEATPVEGSHAAHDHGEQREAGWHLNLWIGVLGTAPLMLGEWVFGLAMLPWFQWASFVIATVVQVFAGAPFYRGAWNQLKAGSSNMDTLVALGSTTAYAYSAWALLSGARGHLYFMEAAAIITLISVGHWIEARVGARASSALKTLLTLAPALARRREADGAETDVPVAALRVGDFVALRPGDRVPTDGEVVEGESAVDEAMLTGESVPVDKALKAPLYAGTVNLNGRLLMRVTATGEETALAHVIAAVQRAQTSRANIQRLADRVSNVFVPVVVLVALATALWWGLAFERATQAHHWLANFLWHAALPETALAAAFIGAAAVLIIACPCAMGLATPAAIMAGSNAAARRGILIRDGVALEKAGEVTAVIFDKTGTLTAGKPEVAGVYEAGSRHHSEIAPGDHEPRGSRREEAQIRRTEGDQSLLTSAATKGGFEERIQSGSSRGPEQPSDAVAGIPAKALAAALARHSTHPISQAVAKLATEEVAFSDWQELRGAGVQGRWQSAHQPSQTIRLGSLKWLGECGVSLAPAQAFVAEWSAQGATVLGLAADQSLLAGIAVKDTVKPGAAAVVAQLQRQGMKTFLVTGDKRLTALSIAQQAGIPAENVFAEVRPEQKAAFVRQLQQRGERVAFVGDGINDAPALEQADLGVAVSRASDIAREAADIILLNSEIEAVPESLGLARATLRTIRQNLFWAFFYNAAGVPLAALGFLSPVLCALAMGLSDLIVIGNALQLRRWRMAG
jgi:Cu+-exporting ATPase